MDDFARLPRGDRRAYFEQTAARLGLSGQMIEKDFWVCWTLKRLFSLAEFQGHLTFKGGTTLSKVYNVIERFSEDVDVAIERAFLGFGGENEPEGAPTGKQQRARIEGLIKLCQQTVAGRLQPLLRQAVATALGYEAGWTLSLDPSDPDGQSLRFEYPPSITGASGPHFAAAVKIELGARSDHFPVANRTIAPYASEAFPDAFAAAHVQLRVLAAVRTFWEKATILHRVHHLPEGNQLPLRMSRHYYDVFKLYRSAIWSEVLNSISLLDRVVQQTTVYFARAWAHYDEASRGMLRLSPPEQIVGLLKQDYRDMRPMFFHEPPPFEEILAHLPTIENCVNESKR
jgi:hypothetical protein